MVSGGGEKHATIISWEQIANRWQVNWLVQKISYLVIGKVQSA